MEYKNQNPIKHEDGQFVFSLFGVARIRDPFQPIQKDRPIGFQYSSLTSGGLYAGLALFINTIVSTQTIGGC